MIKAKRNYEIYDKELMAIVRALEDWRHFLEGLPRPFEILTDHKNLEYWRTACDLTRRQARWALWLSRFDFMLTHKPGKKNVLADALSRMPGSDVTDGDDNRAVMVLKPEQFRTLAAATLESKDTFENMVCLSTDYNPEVKVGLEKLRWEGSKKLANGTLEWEEKDGCIYHHGRLYIPRGNDLRKEAMRRCHDALAVGHPGQFQTLEEVRRYYWWPGMEKFVRRYVAGCEVCAQGKPAVHPRGPLNPLPVPDGPWQVVGVDLVGPLPLSDGYDMILTYVDHFTKQAHFIPCNSTVTAEGVADMHVKHIFRLHGTPEKFVSDRGPQFAARIMKELYCLLGIEHAMSTSYHLQTNGQTERTNQEIGKYLRLYCSEEPEKWA